MKTLKTNHYQSLKGIFFMLAVTIGGSAGTTLINATDYFELTKGAVLAIVTAVIAVVYVLLEKEEKPTTEIPAEELSVGSEPPSS